MYLMKQHYWNEYLIPLNDFMILQYDPYIQDIIWILFCQRNSCISILSQLNPLFHSWFCLSFQMRTTWRVSSIENGANLIVIQSRDILESLLKSHVRMAEHPFGKSKWFISMFLAIKDHWLEEMLVDEINGPLSFFSWFRLSKSLTSNLAGWLENDSDISSLFNLTLIDNWWFPDGISGIGRWNSSQTTSIRQNMSLWKGSWNSFRK